MWHIRDDLVTIYRLINTVWTDKWHFLVYDNLAIARHRKKKKKKKRRKVKYDQVCLPLLSPGDDAWSKFPQRFRVSSLNSWSADFSFLFDHYLIIILYNIYLNGRVKKNIYIPCQRLYTYKYIYIYIRPAQSNRWKEYRKIDEKDIEEKTQIRSCNKVTNGFQAVSCHTWKVIGRLYVWEKLT